MNKLIAMMVCTLAGCILSGCGSSRTKSSHQREINSTSYQVAMEREVGVGIDNPGSNSGVRKLTENLSFVCRIQLVGSRHPDSSVRYRVLFEDMAVERTDFLKELSLTDPVTELTGKSFEVLVERMSQL